MKSKTSYFNRTLFLNLLKRFWPIFAGYFAIWLIILPLSLANMIQYSSITTEYSEDVRAFVAMVGQYVLNTGVYGGVVMSGVFGIIIAMAAFSYLYNARSVSMVASLPIKREGVFLSVFSSGLLMMYAINVLVFLITLAVEVAFGAEAFALSYLLQWLAMVSMLNLFFFGFASLVANFTGHLAVLPIVYIILNFTVYVVELLVKSVMSMFIYGMSMIDTYALVSFSPPVKLLMRSNIVGIFAEPENYNSLTIGCFYDGWTTLAIYAAVGVVFAALAMLLNKHRRMETASDVVAVKPLKPVFKYCLSIGCALVLGIIIYQAVFSNPSNFHGVQGMLIMLLFMLFGAFIGYFAAEMLMQKTLHVFSGRNWLNMGIVAALIASLMFCGEYDVFGIEKKLPDPSQVESASINCSGEGANFEQTENIEALIKLHGDIVSHKKANESFLGDINASSNYVTIRYALKNGKTLTREYNIFTDASGDIYAINDLMNVKEAIDFRKSLSIAVSENTVADAYLNYFDKSMGTYSSIELSPQQAYALYTECIYPDIDAGLLGKVWLVTNDDYWTKVYDCTINLSIEERIKKDNYRSDYFYTTLTVDAERTKKWIVENLGIELATMGESTAILNSSNDGKFYDGKNYPITTID